jgi:hypothetical protein
MNSNILSIFTTKTAALIISTTVAIAAFLGLTMTACSPSSPEEGSGEVVDGSVQPTDASAAPTDGSSSVADTVVAEDTVVSEDAPVSDGSGSAPESDAAVTTDDAVVLDPVDAVLDTDAP